MNYYAINESLPLGLTGVGFIRERSDMIVAPEQTDWWFSSGSPAGMIKKLQHSLSNRKACLFACACCRRIWDLLNENCRTVIDLMEDLADHQTSNALLNQAILKAWFGPDCLGKSATLGRLYRMKAVGLAEDFSATLETYDFITMSTNAATARAIASGGSDLDFRQAILLELQSQSVLLRDIVGNPFTNVRPPCNLSDEARQQAAEIYVNRFFNHLPSLGNILQKDTAEAEIILHCRSELPHVRGCYVIDILLGKN